MRRSALLFASILSVLMLTAGCERAQTFMIGRAADRAVAGDRTDWLDDGNLHVILCGTGSPLPDRDRAAACTAIIAGGKLWLVDTGPGSWENVQLWRLPRAELGGVLLTHFHSDHIGELGEVATQSWIAGRTEVLPVYGPPGVEDVVDGFNRAYAADARYRVAHHGEEAMPAAAGLMRAVPIAVDGDSPAQVLEGNGLVISAFGVDHEPVDPAYGYRFDYGDRSVVVSGDTKRSESLIRNARGADVLVHEALAAHIVERLSTALGERGADRLARLASDILDYHATPAEAAEVAGQAGVPMLVLTHLVPPLQNAVARRMFTRGMKPPPGVKVVIAEDGTYVALEAGTSKVDIDTLEDE